MANIFNTAFFNNLVACFTTFTFATTVIYPPTLHAAQVNLNLNALNFELKVEKLFEKIKKAIDRGETNKIVGYMFEIKSEVEQYTGNKIDIGKQLDQVQKEAKEVIP